MNISQLARSQRMMYQFISRATNGSDLSQLSSLLPSGGKNDSTTALLQSMGFSDAQGQTVREMARYQLRVQEDRKSVEAQKPDAEPWTAAAAAKQFTARQQYAPISEKATEVMQKLALADAKSSAQGKAADRTERARVIREQLKDVDPAKRAAAFNTMNKVWESETERIGTFIREQDSKWGGWGDRFDPSLLDGYRAGVNVWV